MDDDWLAARFAADHTRLRAVALCWLLGPSVLVNLHNCAASASGCAE